jgi:hypothetical protein
MGIKSNPAYTYELLDQNKWCNALEHKEFSLIINLVLVDFHWVYSRRRRGELKSELYVKHRI